ncbi:DUF5316 domain-containing protein [Paenibacillus sp. DYY-L-2]|uniref:DUF5316 domain-containing protein n=1 Tax=Paenibacillus sp. DYY-L-2 TaxID=3447013 RepID=UPI003F4F8739
MDDWGFALKVTGGAGVVLWILSGILSGAFISGDRTRANENIETDEDRTFRNKHSSILFLFGLPFLIIALIIYLTT